MEQSTPTVLWTNPLTFVNILTRVRFSLQGGKDVASWLRSGVIGKPQFDPVTKEIRASHKATSDVTSQVGGADSVEDLEQKL